MTSRQARIGRLRWRGRRGMKELDNLIARYLEHHLDKADENTVQALERLLDCQDTDLLDWLLGRSEPSDTQLRDLVEKIRLT